MRLYPKKLNNIEELQAERRRLKAQSHLSVMDVLSSSKEDTIQSEKTQQQESSSADNFSFYKDIISGFVYNNSPARLADTIVNVAIPILKYAGVKVEQKAVKSIAKDVILSYAKWKAIELGYKSVYSYFRAKRNK